MSDERGSFGVSEVDSTISPGEVILWFMYLLLGLAFALYVRTLIIRHMNQRIRDQQRDVLSTLNRRKQGGASTMTRQTFVEQNLTSYHWQPTDIPTELAEEQHLEFGVTEDQKDTSAECSICLSSFRCNDLVSKSNNRECNHVFHKSCVQEWLILHVECPMCREEFLIPPIFHTPSIQTGTVETDSLRTAATAPVASTTESVPSEHPNEPDLEA